MLKIIPPSVGDIPSNAERKIFECIQKEKGFPGWFCFHSLGIARHIYKHEGEADFVLLGERGLFVLEIKGGQVTRRDGVWVFTDRHGRATEKKESPFEQARSAAYSIKNDLRQRFGKRVDAYVFGYGVVFPDIEFGMSSPEWDTAIVMDQRAMKKPIGEYLESMISYWEARPDHRMSIGHNDLQEIAAYLRGDFERIRPVKADIDQSEEELIRLTEGQYAALDALSSNKRLIFSGPAGTGKTLIAMEKARRNAASKIRTLFICFNRLLGAHLSNVTMSEGNAEWVHPVSLHKFFHSVIAKAGLSDEFKGAASGKKHENLFRDVYPEFFLRAWKTAGVPYDELIIDEGQDILIPEYISALDATFEGGFRKGRWNLFLDPENQQGMFKRFDQGLFDELCENSTQYVLDVNCRNTKPIAIQAEVVSGFPMAEIRRVEGLPVVFLWHEDQAEEALHVSDAVNKLLADGIDPGEITLLSTRNSQTSLASSGLLRLHAPTFDLDEKNVSGRREGKIACTNVQSYKGLESSIIFLTDVDDIATDWMRIINYVGFTRARNGLWVCMAKNLRKEYKRLITDIAVRSQKKYPDPL